MKSSERPSAKGIISTLELMGVVVALFVAFSIFFPEPVYTDNWKNAYLYLMSKDILSTLVAAGNLESYMSNDTTMQELFNNIGGHGYIFWHRAEGIKHNITMACACPQQEINKLGEWTRGLRFNDRDIEVSFCYADIGNPESGCMKNSDALIVWGYRALNEQTLTNYLIENKGIIELADFSSSPDAVQQSIFGIQGGGVWRSDRDVILEPGQASQITYDPYKIFYNIPLALYGTQEDDLTSCETAWNGTFTVNTSSYWFWVCNGSSVEPYVYFDLDSNGIPDSDELLALGELFSLEGSNFNISYIDGAKKIRVTFLDSPKYKFFDFIRPPAGGEGILPTNGDLSRVLVKMDSVFADVACGVVLNSLYGSRTAWIANFTRNGLDSVGDDHRQLLISLILYVSKKYEGSEPVYNIRRGYISSYITTTDIDVFEIRKYDVGVGYPY